MNRKSIVFFDIDGTLLDHKKKLPTSAKEAIFQLKKKGHEVAIATGRAPFMFENLRKELDIDSYISYNGQYAVLNGEEVYKKPLDIEALSRLTQFADTKQHPLVYMNQETMKSTREEHPYVDEALDTLHIPNPHPEMDKQFYIGRETYQALLFCQEGERKAYVDNFKEFEFIRWHPVSVDVLPVGGSKANGIKQMIEKAGYDKQQVFAFGDGLNDIKMLQSVMNSVAMGNAHEEVKKIAKYITKTVDEDGIYYGLKMVGLLD